MIPWWQEDIEEDGNDFRPLCNTGIMLNMENFCMRGKISHGKYKERKPSQTGVALGDGNDQRFFAGTVC